MRPAPKLLPSTTLALLLALSLPPAPIAASGCAGAETAHEALLAASFTTERRFAMTLNGELKGREVARLTYRAGELEREVVEFEQLDKKVVLEPGEGESALEIPFACDRFRSLGGGRYALGSPDGLEETEFEWSGEAAAPMRPVEFRYRETVRLLWKKLEAEATAEYVDFAWLPADPAEPPTER